MVMLHDGRLTSYLRGRNVTEICITIRSASCTCHVDYMHALSKFAFFLKFLLVKFNSASANKVRVTHHVRT